MNCFGSYPECPCRCCYSEQNSQLERVGNLIQNTGCCSLCEKSKTPQPPTLPWIGDNRIEERRVFSYKPPPRFYLSFNGVEYEFKDLETSNNNIINVTGTDLFKDVVIENATDVNQYRSCTFNIVLPNSYFWQTWNSDSTHFVIRADFVNNATETRIVTIQCVIDGISRYISLNINTTWRLPTHPVYTKYTLNYSPAGVGGVQSIIDSTLFSQQTVTNQAPDGCTWLSLNDWSYWDGVPLSKSRFCSMTKEELHAYLFPKNEFCLLGLREHYYRINPFNNPSNPTVAEVDNWNVEVIRHLRAVCGINYNINPVQHMFCQSQWSQERFWTSYWDVLYPSGICNNNPPINCGSTFWLNYVDQTPYGVHLPYNIHSDSIGDVDTSLPWCIKMSKLIGQFIQENGRGDPLYPFLSRPLVGFSFHVNNQITRIRTCFYFTILNPCS